MFMAPDTTKGPEDRVLQNWPQPSLTNTREYWSCPSLAAAFWREAYTSPGQHNGADPVHRGTGKVALRA